MTLNRWAWWILLALGLRILKSVPSYWDSIGMVMILLALVAIFEPRQEEENE